MPPSMRLMIFSNNYILKIRFWKEGRINTWHMVAIFVKCGIGISFGILLSMINVLLFKLIASTPLDTFIGRS